MFSYCTATMTMIMAGVQGQRLGVHLSPGQALRHNLAAYHTFASEHSAFASSFFVWFSFIMGQR
jgi:hypothetical protein